MAAVDRRATKPTIRPEGTCSTEPTWRIRDNAGSALVTAYRDTEGHLVIQVWNASHDVRLNPCATDLL
jgi:hypothetical protein